MTSVIVTVLSSFNLIVSITYWWLPIKNKSLGFALKLSNTLGWLAILTYGLGL